MLIPVRPEIVTCWLLKGNKRKGTIIQWSSFSVKWRGELYEKLSRIFIKIYSLKLHLNTIFKAQKWCNPSPTQVCFRNLVWNSLRVCSCKANGGCNLVSPVPVNRKQVHSRAGSRGQCCSGELQPLSSPRGPWFRFQKLEGPWVHSSVSSQLLCSTLLSAGFPPVWPDGARAHFGVLEHGLKDQPRLGWEVVSLEKGLSTQWASLLIHRLKQQREVQLSLSKGHGGLHEAKLFLL